MVNCFNNKLLNTFTLYFDIHNRNWQMCMEYINMLKVMTGNHALLYRTFWIYCFHFPRKIHKYLTFYKKKKNYTIHFFVLKKCKTVKRSLKARYLRAPFRMIFSGANIFRIIFYIDFALATCLRKNSKFAI